VNRGDERGGCGIQPVAAELGAAQAMRRAGADPKALCRALRRIEELLDE
jgi:hypothetical protein